MHGWILILILALVAIGAIVLFIAMFTEMGTKRSTGTMKGAKKSGGGGTKSRNKPK